MKKTKKKFKVGEKVFRCDTRMSWDDQDTSNEIEYGVVVSHHWDNLLCAWNCYVAFVGNKNDFETSDIPYVLRYFESSLTRLK